LTWKILTFSRSSAVPWVGYLKIYRPLKSHGPHQARKVGSLTVGTEKW
jgi:hypothetical protein